MVTKGCQNHCPSNARYIGERERFVNHQVPVAGSHCSKSKAQSSTEEGGR